MTIKVLFIMFESIAMIIISVHHIITINEEFFLHILTLSLSIQILNSLFYFNFPDLLLKFRYHFPFLLISIYKIQFENYHH